MYVFFIPPSNILSSVLSLAIHGVDPRLVTFDNDCYDNGILLVVER